MSKHTVSVTRTTCTNLPPAEHVDMALT